MTINLSTIDFSGVSSGPSAKLQEKTATILLTDTTTEILPDEGYDGMSKVSVSHGPVQETVEQTITENGSHRITPSEGYDAMIQCVVDVNVQSGGDTEKYMNKKPYADETGLTSLGWDNESINYYKYNNYLYPWEFEKTKLTTEEIQTNLASCVSSETWETNKKQVTFVPKNQAYTPTLFNGCDKLKSVPLIDLSSRTSVSGMFYNNPELINVPLFDTSNIVKFGSDQNYSNAGMICLCPKIKNIPLFDTSKGEIFGGMLRECSGLEKIPLFDTSKGKDFHHMFYDCTNLKTIPQLNLSNGINFGNMFDGCQRLTSIPSLNTSHGTQFGAMFYRCYELVEIGGIDASSATNFGYFVDACFKLTDITFIGSINANINFSDCKKLTYDSIKSILTACAATTNTNAKTVSFNRTIADQNNELTNLVASCTEKGWAVTGLTLQ